MSQLLDTLAAELERPRELSRRVMNYVSDRYGVDYAGVGLFLTQELPDLEEDEVDLILSPVFTPKLTDQAVFAELLGNRSVPKNDWPGLVQQLVARPARAHLITPDGKSHEIALREVTVERYLYRLRLEGRIPDAILRLVSDIAEKADRPMLLAVARRAIWEDELRREILAVYLTAAPQRGLYLLSDALQLLDYMESYKPAGISELAGRIPQRLKNLREEIDRGSPQQFLNPNIEYMHGGGRDQRQHDAARLAGKQNELEFLERLERVLAA